MDTRIVFILRLNPENYIGKTNTQPYGQMIETGNKLLFRA
jgi:hypothetical protein